MARMAKGKRSKSDKLDKAEVLAADGKSLLDVAWRSYQAGDMVLARRAAKLVLAGASKDADEAVAKKVGKELFAEGYVADARQVAQDLITRTNPPPKPFLLAGAAALIWVVLLLIANRG
jgi:hypothetical protein